MSAQKQYLSFCLIYNIAPLPLSELATCLFTAFLAHQGLKPQSINAYLLTLRYLQVSSGLNAPHRANLPGLQYVLNGIARCHPISSRQWLSITASIMSQILYHSSTGLPRQYRGLATMSCMLSGLFQIHAVWGVHSYYGFTATCDLSI